MSENEMKKKNENGIKGGVGDIPRGPRNFTLSCPLFVFARVRKRPLGRRDKNLYNFPQGQGEAISI